MAFHWSSKPADVPAQLVLRRPLGRRAHDQAVAGRAHLVDDLAQPAALVVAQPLGDAEGAAVGHQHGEAAGQGDLLGQAGALGPDGVLGDLAEDGLAGPQHLLDAGLGPLALGAALHVVTVVADVAAVEDGVLRDADVDERRLHPGQDVLDPAAVDVPVDLGGLVGRPGDVVLDQRAALQHGDLGRRSAGRGRTPGTGRPSLPLRSRPPRRRIGTAPEVFLPSPPSPGSVPSDVGIVAAVVGSGAVLASSIAGHHGSPPATGRTGRHGAIGRWARRDLGPCRRRGRAGVADARPGRRRCRPPPGPPPADYRVLRPPGAASVGAGPPAGAPLVPAGPGVGRPFSDSDMREIPPYAVHDARSWACGAATPVRASSCRAAPTGRRRARSIGVSCRLGPAPGRRRAPPTILPVGPHGAGWPARLGGGKYRSLAACRRADPPSGCSVRTAGRRSSSTGRPLRSRRTTTLGASSNRSTRVASSSAVTPNTSRSQVQDVTSCCSEPASSGMQAGGLDDDPVR